ncbi:hypothetical protein V5799_016919 [Amblyomma americanum]|uniref:Secreted protein n=1 Tax=Amblyomma americanum TaxID=6943 RepID=A0AAQ4F4C0_AMBAM
MKLVYAVAILTALVALTTASGKGGKGKGSKKAQVIVLDSYPERRPVYDYPPPRQSYDYAPSYDYVEIPSKKMKQPKMKKQKVHFVERPSYDYYDYGNAYDDYDDYYVQPKVKKTKHVRRTYRQYREPVYYDQPKKAQPINLHIKVVSPKAEKKKEVQQVPVYIPMYKDRIQHVPVHHNVPYPVYVQPPPVNYHPPQQQKRVYHHPPKPVYNPLRKMNQPLFLKVALLARTKLPPIPNHTLKSIKIFTATIRFGSSVSLGACPLYIEEKCIGYNISKGPRQNIRQKFFLVRTVLEVFLTMSS